MSYTALYRKFRPTTFEDVRGQEHIITTLQNPDFRRTGSGMRICFAEPEEQERLRLRKYLPKR